MNYIKYKILCANADAADILIADLADLGFESFTDFADNAFEAYIQEPLATPQINDFLKNANLEFSSETIEQQNWNAQWESNFSPIDVEGKCYIRATFHEPNPSAKYDIIITPKMSFGTGHHPTTHLVVQSMLDSDLASKQGLDMGSGTGILAILAAKLGAQHIDAVDIDDWAYENCLENIALNNVSQKICPILGDASKIKDNISKYDFILANINRNIILADIETYVNSLRSGGTITMSGFLEIDIETIEKRSKELGLSRCSTLVREGWGCLTFRK